MVAGAVDLSSKIDWESDSLRSLGLEVLAARLDHTYVSGYGPGRVWQLTATFIPTGGEDSTLPEFRVKLELCDAFGAVLGESAEEARTVGSRFAGQASAVVTADTRTKKAAATVEHFIATVEPVRVDIPVRWNRERFEHAGVSVIRVAAALVRERYSSAKLTLSAALESRTFNCPNLQAIAVSPAGLPLPIAWNQKVLMAPTSVMRQFAGSTEWTHDGDTPDHLDLITLEDFDEGPPLVQRLGTTATPSARLEVTDLSATTARTSGYLHETTVQVAGVVRRSDAHAVEATPDGINATLTMNVVTTTGRVAGTYRHWVWLDFGPDECEGHFWVRFPILLPDPEEILLEVRVGVC